MILSILCEQLTLSFKSGFTIRTLSRVVVIQVQANVSFNLRVCKGIPNFDGFTVQVLVPYKTILLGVILATPVALKGLFLVMLSPMISKLGSVIQFLFALATNILLRELFLVYFQ